MPLLRIFAGILLCLLASRGVHAQSGAAAQGIIDAGFRGDSINLMSVLKRVETTRADAVIEIPADASGQKAGMQLSASIAGARHRWAVFTLHNPAAASREFVLEIPDGGFVSSGVVWPRLYSRHVRSLRTSNGAAPRPVNALNAEAFVLSVGAGKTVTFAAELTPASLTKAVLWHRAAFDNQISQLTFFYGVLLGIAGLTAIAVVSLFIVRPQMVFPAAGLFVWACVVFLALNAGYYQVVEAWAPAILPGPARARALAESAMFAGIALTLTSFLQLARRQLVLFAFFVLLALSGFALMWLGLSNPAPASGLARIGFAITVVSGLATILALRADGVIRAKASLFSWLLLTAWTLAAAAGALGLAGSLFIGQAISAGLVLVLVAFGFTLAQFAFSKGITSSQFLEDSGRRALALAGSEQSVWDWQVDSASLFVGQELERALGLASGSLSTAGLKSWLARIHPADRPAYVSAVEAAERRGTGTFSQEFRLRRADGAYRWFLLRARAVAGDDGRASRLIGTLTDVTTIKRSEDRLLSDAVRDRVTGLPNRALFIDRLDRAMRRAAAGGHELYVIVIDLDRFKNVNDGLGHEVGDSLLSVTARRLGGLTTSSDTLARLGGDQFGMIFSNENNDRDVIELATAIQESLSAPINVRPREIFLTASLGLALFEPGRDTPQTLLKNAEIALYEVKATQNGAIEFFQAGMSDDRSRLVALEQDLRGALERGEIEVVYQPIQRLADGELAGFEALVRWRHAEQGLLSPDVFIAMAEETGIIREVGRFVLAESARQLGIWQRAFRPSDPLFVAVNVSSAQLLNYDLVGDLKALLQREDIVPGTLKLELTETLVMQNPELSAKVLQRIASLGVGLSCDDFGTGYSALANLRRLPFDTLKIDKSFLDADGEDEAATIIFDTIIQLAHNLNLLVVAEGVESESQLMRLSAANCDFAQGYHIGQPVSAKQVIEALGGLPYVEKGERPVMSVLWERLTGAGTATEAQAPAAMPEPPDLPDSEDDSSQEAEEEELIPWSPQLWNSNEGNGEPPREEPPASEPLDPEPPAPEPPAPESEPPVAAPQAGTAPLAPRVAKPRREPETEPAPEQEPEETHKAATENRPDETGPVPPAGEDESAGKKPDQPKYRYSPNGHRPDVNRKKARVHHRKTGPGFTATRPGRMKNRPKPSPRKTRRKGRR